VMQSALFDPQTAGGLLISVNRSEADALIDKIDGAVRIGEVQTRADHLLEVV